MRALFMDIEDYTLFTAKVDFVLYDPNELFLRFYSGEDEIVIPGIAQKRADEIIRQIYADGMVDVTAYPAHLNDDPSEYQ